MTYLTPCETAQPLSHSSRRCSRNQSWQQMELANQKRQADKSKCWVFSLQFSSYMKTGGWEACNLHGEWDRFLNYLANQRVHRAVKVCDLCILPLWGSWEAIKDSRTPTILLLTAEKTQPHQMIALATCPGAWCAWARG